MKRSAVYPGSFDPISQGHLDVIKRVASIFDEVIVAVLVNPDKRGLFNIEERVELIKRVTSDMQNVRVDSFEGLLVDYMNENECNVIIKGLRCVSDFEYELQMAHMNKKLDSNIETMFIMSNPKYSYVSSSSIKQVAMFGGNVEGLVPDEILRDITLRINRK